MKLGCLNTDDNKINPKPSTRLAGKYIPGGCCRRRRKLTMPTNRGMVVVPRGWFGVVRKKFLVKTKLTPHNKNIIIIHNNTSIASNEEDNRKSSCVEPGKDQIVAAAVAAATTKIKDGGQQTQDLKDQKLPPGDAVIEDKPSTVTTTNDSGGQENGLKDRKKESDGGGVEDGSGMMTNTVTATKKEDGNQEKDLKDHNEIDDETIVEERVTLPGVDAEADPSASSEAVAVDSGIEKEEEEVQAGPSDKEKAVAAIRIQTAFRGHLARRAFRALKGLVKLQAVVRGVVVRRQARMALHCMRALVRLGDRVRARQLLSRSSDE